MAQLCDKIDCTGCSACYNACANNAIIMHSDQEGFLVPQINNELCTNCGLCETSCPVLHPYNMSSHQNVCYAAFAKDQNIRQRGSSGGIFTILANWIIKNNGVVVGAATDEYFVVNHQIAESKEKLRLLQGSKYVQSNIGLIFKEIRKLLNNKRYVLFVGVSCQIAGLLKYLRKEYANLYTVDLVCHGVPSPKIFAKYIEYLKSSRPYMESFSFRDLKGWSCNSSSSSSRLPNGKIRNEALYGVDSGYFNLFINGYMNREACYNCPYAQVSPRIGDITLADFWGIGKGQPYNQDTSKGVSMVSTNTNKGIEIFNCIKEDIVFEPRDIKETILYGNNVQLERPATRPVERDEFYQNAYRLNWPDLLSLYNLNLKKRPGYLKRIKNRIKDILIYIKILP